MNNLNDSKINNDLDLKTITDFCRRKGFVYPSSEIYGGYSAVYDFGPLGTLLKKNIEKAWRNYMITYRDDVVEIEGAIFLHPKVWEASGHVGGFSDILVEDIITRKRYRADHLIEDAKVSLAVLPLSNILLATSNQGKVKRYQKNLDNPNINLISLQDLNLKIESPKEGQETEQEIVKAKVTYYQQITGKTCLASDIGLYFPTLPKDKQPGRFSKRIAGVDEELDDKETVYNKMSSYYSSLARENGGSLEGYFLDCYCLFDGKNYYQASAKRKITVTDVVYKKDIDLPICSVYQVAGIYYHDLTEKQMQIFLEPSNLAIRKIIKDYQNDQYPITNAGHLTLEEIDSIISYHNLLSPDKNPLSKSKKFNLMVKTHLGPVEDSSTVAYLKGESCQNIYVDWKQVLETTRKKLPFGIAQHGKAFRNEITARQFIFRTRELEQVDVQFFVKPEAYISTGEYNPDQWYRYWKDYTFDFYSNGLGLNKNLLSWRQHDADERAFYAKDAWDIQFQFGNMGDKEIAGLHNRGTYDLDQHSKYSKQDLTYFDQEKNVRYNPEIVEISLGLGRMFLAVIFNNYKVERLTDGEDRIVLALPKHLSPYAFAILPLMKKDGLSQKAQEIFHSLKKIGISVDYDDAGSIGKRYRRQDENGTFACICVDYQTLEDQTVTVRDRDTMEQKRVLIEDLLK